VTRGDRPLGVHHLMLVHADLAAVRARELDASLAALGVTDSVRFGYPDSGHVPGFDGVSELDPGQHGLAPDCFYRVPFERPLERLVALIRATRPEVLVTYPPDGDCPHPDHTRTHLLTVAAYEAAADPERFPDAGAPWVVAKLYYTTVSDPARSASIDAASQARALGFANSLTWLATTANPGPPHPDAPPRSCRSTPTGSSAPRSRPSVLRAPRVHRRSPRPARSHLRPGCGRCWQFRRPHRPVQVPAHGPVQIRFGGAFR